MSARGRILRQVPHGALPALPRIWVAAGTDVPVGTTLAPDSGARAAAALAIAQEIGFRARIVSVTVAGPGLSFKLRSGLELRLGTAADLALKLAVAAKILPLLAHQDASYLDVSLPTRPVAMAAPAVSVNPRVAGRG